MARYTRERRVAAHVSYCCYLVPNALRAFLRALYTRHTGITYCKRAPKYTPVYATNIPTSYVQYEMTRDKMQIHFFTDFNSKYDCLRKKNILAFRKSPRPNSFTFVQFWTRYRSRYI